MPYAGGLLLFVVGCFIGLKLPDFDQAFYWRPLIEHRSLLTHGPLIALLLWLALRPQLTLKDAAGKPSSPGPRLFLMGFCLASSVHLCFDLFPRAWGTYALIHVPLVGRMTWGESFAWITAGAVGCLYLACRLLRGKGDLSLACLALATCYGVSAAHEPYQSFFALLALLAVALVAFLLPRPSHDPGSPSDEISRWIRS